MTRMTDVVLPPTFEQTASAGSAVWHESLPIQINWTYEIDYCTARIFCPGNVHRWEMAIIQGPDPEQTKAYARLITAAPAMLAALERAREAVNAIVLSTHSVSFDADLRAIDAAIAAAKGAA